MAKIRITFERLPEEASSTAEREVWSCMTSDDSNLWRKTTNIFGSIFLQKDGDINA